eukprot:TRINITY_DN12689_c0_g1_i1.p1 TRINITY_DN12689_c0_g1~~TRINITY_DN12689_c0_g1_i1.p1  ORF type:complete len:628 (+),score=64.92 TRINITY_DN12689_c0_g1_i1:138-1886(+)
MLTEIGNSVVAKRVTEIDPEVESVDTLRADNRRLELGDVDIGSNNGSTSSSKQSQLEAMPSTVALLAPRSRAESWTALPQRERGITLGELEALVHENREWLESLMWRCDGCKTRQPQDGGPCAACGVHTGKRQMPNLYEVNKDIIMPKCTSSGVSFVEMLAGKRESFCGVLVETFVSHWWGEEFLLLVRSLRRYAEARCASHCTWRWTASTFAVSSVIGPVMLVIILNRFHVRVTNATDLDETESALGVLGQAFILCWNTLLVALCTVLASRYLDKRPRDPSTWSFWICAFANNQYALEHSLPTDGVKQSSFAVALRAPTCKEVFAILDDEGQLYSRIWCVFELFFATRVLSTLLGGRPIAVSIGNEHGVVSDGDAPLRTVKWLTTKINGIQVADAQASVETDRIMIWDEINQMNTKPDELDQVLRAMAKKSLQTVRLRHMMPSVVVIMICAAATLGWVRDFRIDPGWGCFVAGVFLVGFALLACPLPWPAELQFVPRAICLVLIITAPSGVFIVAFSVLTYAEVGTDDPIHRFMQETYTLVSMSAVAAASCSLLFGISWIFARNWQGITRLRRFVEDVFFA